MKLIVKQIFCIKLLKYWDKYTEMHGQQNDKYTEMHGQQNVQIWDTVSWNKPTHLAESQQSTVLTLSA